MNEKFRVGITRDALNADGELRLGEIGLSMFDDVEGVEWEFLPEDAPELSSEMIQGYDALLVFGRWVTTAALDGADNLTIVARFGVGYDRVDVDACTRNGVFLTITPEGVRRPVASAFMAFILALSHKLLIKDRVTRAGRWNEGFDDLGMGLTGRVLGLVGLGNIGREILVLAKPFGMRHLAYDPYVNSETAAAAGAELVDLDTLLHSADFVCICCLLNEETYRLINAERISLMKRTAYLINVARGPIVDQQALTRALTERRIRGAAMDVFDQEPIDPDDPILKLENVIVSPHALPMTDECALGIGRSAIGSILDVAAGRIPRDIVNRSALDHPRLQERLRTYGVSHSGR